jgi:hypothetical protein
MNTLYAVARTVLLDAHEVLGEQRAAVILAAAQAIYLHTAGVDSVSEFMADLALPR